MWGYERRLGGVGASRGFGRRARKLGWGRGDRSGSEGAGSEGRGWE